MTDYTTFEYSPRDSNPIELYHFYDSANNWYYCNGTETAFTFGGNSYIPAVISKSQVNSGQNSYDERIDIEVPTGLAIITDSMGRFQSEKIYVKVYRVQDNRAAYYKIQWYGYISNFVYNDQTTKIIVESITAAFEKRVIKYTFSSQCRHILFGGSCGLVEAANKTDGIITSITDGTTISAVVFNTSTPNNFLSSMIVTEDGERRVIIADDGNGNVTILRPFNSAAVGTIFYVTNKCNRLITGLCAKKGNTANFGGFQLIKNNPYEEIIIDSGAGLTNPIT
jgi:hypothetical protein